ncbi:ABC transporter substrate-binding protein [Nakamurella aerolata]|uniref:ABC transporter substrate-binding protein n=1 Tax=Nakamurella aerolata TaxID=1656892 RepID=A0A849A1C0_9ACTN|nr:ABC transporter substrate-binding protein [Nakamurella aerolata]NNG34834.1 ABC transporter substrate-binding protein [Nakamurella aerolata]
MTNPEFEQALTRAQLAQRGLNRRRFLSFAGLGAGSIALAACGGPSTASSSSSTSTAGPAAAGAGAPAGSSGAGSSAGSSAGSAGDAAEFAGVKPASTITFWSNHPGDSADVENEIIKAFNASGAGVTVKLVTAGSNYEEIATKFQAAQQAKKGLPDLLVLSDVWWFRYRMSQSILPLNNVLAAAELDTAAYREGLIKDYQYGGEQWAVPFARSTPLFYYNKEHWKKAGLEDRAPKTWQEFAEWAVKLQAAGTGAQNAFQLPALADYAGWTFQNNLWGEGGGWSKEGTFDITCADKESVQALQFLQDAVYKGKWSGVSSKSATDDLSAGAVSATLGSTGSLVGVQKAAKFDLGVGFLPGGSVSQSPVCPTGGSGLGITASVPKENQLAAAMFIKFATNPENTVKFAQATGYLPVRTDADISGLVKANPLAKTAIDQLAVTRVQDNARVFIPGADQEMAKACAAILTQQASVQQSMDGLKAKLEQMYASDVEPNL